jgi:hypothetical protein
MPDIDQSNYESRTLFAKVKGKNGYLRKVKCKVWLPNRITNNPLIHFYPNRTQMTFFKNNWEIEVSIGLEQQGGTIFQKFEAPCVYLTSRQTSIHTPKLIETIVVGELDELSDSMIFDAAKAEQVSEVKFWLSPNDFLVPNVFQEIDDDGEIRYDRQNLDKFKLDDNSEIAIDSESKSKKLKNGDTLKWSNTIATISTSVSADDFLEIKRNLIPKIDDFALLVSLSTRYDTKCVGWTSCNTKVVSRYYRCFQPSNANQNQAHSYNLLIDRPFLREFLTYCIPKLRAELPDSHLRYAIHSVIPRFNATVESSIKKYFSGLEAIILKFRIENNFEFIMPSTEFRRFQKKLTTAIKDSSKNILSEKQREQIYNKLGELNRISLREAYDAFTQELNIKTDDLWPLFGNSNTIGLSDIRNRLVHGDYFPHRFVDALSIANEHLQYLLERFILATLKWDVAKSHVNPRFLKSHLTALNGYQVEQKRITDFVKRNI